MLGDSTKARTELNWKPKVSFSELVKMMVESDLILAEKEKVLIEQAHTTEGFRLACQTSINGDITARRLVLDSDDIKDMSFDRQGESKNIAILFSDIRGFTPFSEKLTPYDVVFILNRYFKRMVKVIEENHGRVDNYIGDGMVAIFGINDEKILRNML